MRIFVLLCRILVRRIFVWRILFVDELHKIKVITKNWHIIMYSLLL